MWIQAAALWDDPVYRETIGLVVAFLLVLGVLLYALSYRGPRFKGLWASLRSWLIATPIIFLVMGLPHPIPLIGLILIAIYSCKTFFQMVGMYHRAYFVWCTYLFIFLLGFLINRQVDAALFNLVPMIFLGAVSMIPILRNSSQHMVQYMALSLFAFFYFGWSFMHLGRFLDLPKGMLIIIYIFILTEFGQTLSAAVSRHFGRWKLCEGITSRLTLEGLICSMCITTLLAWGLRHLLPYRSEPFWMSAALTAIIFGQMGDLVLSVVRRDLGIKDTGVFIIGRGDILDRVDRMIFVGPVFYYCFYVLEKFYVHAH